MSNQTLSQKSCKSCEGNASPLSPRESRELMEGVNAWNLEGEEKIEKIFLFKDFLTALSFINKVGAIAESEGHHPDIFLFDYKKVRITLTTHAISGLSENDFILAAKIDEMLRS